MQARSGMGSAIAGVGVDVLAVSRMARELERDREGFRAQLFSPAEVAECEARRAPPRHYAALFAAKEALLKALAAGTLDTGVYREAEVLGAGEGRPVFRLRRRLRRLARRRGVASVHLALSHDREMATAFVVVETTEPPTPTPRRGSRA
jgi:holo-[acyl-carrier protein] synthase